MKKTFPLENPPHKPERVVEQIKSEIRKYLKREQRKPLPEGVDFWDFDCRTGTDETGSDETHVSQVIAAVDTASRGSWQSVYVEILAKPGRRSKRPKPTGAPDSLG